MRRSPHKVRYLSTCIVTMKLQLPESVSKLHQNATTKFHMIVWSTLYISLKYLYMRLLFKEPSPNLILLRQKLSIAVEAQTLDAVKCAEKFVCLPGDPTPTGIQHKSFGIPTRIWNLAEESQILSKMESSKIDSNSEYFCILSNYSAY